MAGADGSPRGARRRHRRSPGAPRGRGQNPSRTSSSRTTAGRRADSDAGTRAPGWAGSGRRRPRTARGGSTGGRRRRVGRRRRRSSTAGRHRAIRPGPRRRGPPRGRLGSAASGSTSGRWSTAPQRRAALGVAAATRPAGTDAVVEAHRSRARTSTRTGSSRPTRLRAIRCARSGARPPLSSPGACTPGWTSTSGPRSCRPLSAATSPLDAFQLAREIRELDMRASPYDLRRPRLRAGARSRPRRARRGTSRSSVASASVVGPPRPPRRGDR